MKRIAIGIANPSGKKPAVHLYRGQPWFPKRIFKGKKKILEKAKKFP
jgi:hypothetical protein